MDVATRFSTGSIVDSTSMKSAIFQIELTWISQFWPPTAIQADGAFVNDEFKAFLNQYGIEFRPVPPRRHCKNPIDPRHGVIRSIFLKLKHAEPDVSDELHAIRSVRMSNDLYGTDTLSAYEMAKGYTKPVIAGQLPIAVDDELQKAHEELIAKRKLTLILRSKVFPADSFKIGDLVQVFIKDGKAKRGSWSSPRAVLSIDSTSGTLTIPGRAGKTISAAVEDVRAARVDSDLTAMIQESIDQLDMNLVDCIDNSEQPQTAENADSRNENDQIGDFNGTNDETLPISGDRISIFWPIDNRYYTGTVQSVESDGIRVVHYDDDDVEKLNLSTENWKYDATVSASTSGFSNTLQSNEQEVLSDMLSALGNRSFLRHQAQAFDQSVIVNAYNKEEENFVANVKIVPRSSVPKSANIIGSHTIYKLKQNDDQSLKLKARIAPHGNEDSDKENLHTECCMCPPLGIRIISTTATVRGWRIVRADAKSAFLQTGPA